tara:strand:- start:1076 stop:1234 length:159 start_codon:yes stop_codon:yes gene_type:complete
MFFVVTVTQVSENTSPSFSPPWPSWPLIKDEIRKKRSVQKMGEEQKKVSLIR